MLCIYPSKWTHTAVNTHTHTLWTHTHTHCEHTPGAVGSHLCCGTRGAVGGSVPCSRASRHGIEGGERALYIHSPHLQFLPVRDSNSQPFDYESDSLQLHASSALFMHKLVWDWFYVEHPTHENVFLCRFLQPLWTIWPRTWVCRLREGWSWAIIRQCWDFCRWRRDRLTESDHYKHTFTRSQMHKHLLRPAGALQRIRRHERERLLLWFSRQETLAISFDVTFLWFWACLVPLTGIRGPCSGCRHVDGRKNAFRAFPKTYFHLAVHSRVWISVSLQWIISLVFYRYCYYDCPYSYCNYDYYLL